MGPSILGVVGSPVAHSRSPAMHRHWIARLGLDAAYLCIHLRNQASARRLWDQVPLRGINVTRPFKETLRDLADELGPGALRTGALNTVWRAEDRADRCLGDNTDLDGIHGALDATGIPWTGRTALVLGAGGAARAAVPVLTDAGCAVRVLDRTASRADALGRAFSVPVHPLDELPRWLPWASLVVSTLPAGVWERLPDPGPLPRGTLLLEADYSANGPSPLATQGHPVIASPLDWLLFQGAASFRRFFATEPPLDGVRDLLDHPPRPPRRIALVGFMGAGKSTIAGLLAARLGWEALDLDREVEALIGLPVPEVFRRHGEEAFRRAEEEVLRRLARRDRLVVACGGGSPLRPATREVLRESFWTVWVFITLDAARKRLPASGERPLWRHDSPEAESLWSARRDACARVADLLVDGEDASPEDLAAEIADEARLAL